MCDCRSCNPLPPTRAWCGVMMRRNCLLTAAVSPDAARTIRSENGASGNTAHHHKDDVTVRASRKPIVCRCPAWRRPRDLIAGVHLNLLAHDLACPRPKHLTTCGLQMYLAFYCNPEARESLSRPGTHALQDYHDPLAPLKIIMDSDPIVNIFKATTYPARESLRKTTPAWHPGWQLDCLSKSWASTPFATLPCPIWVMVDSIM